MSVEAKRKELWTKTETYRGFIVAIHVVSVIALTMLQSTSAASAQEDDDILLLLIPSIVAANRVELSANSLAPLELLTVTGRRFDPTAAIAVRFFDDQGYDVEVPVIEASATSVTVSVPPFIDLSTGAFAAGTVDVQVVQKKGGVTRRSIAVPRFGIGPMPDLTLPPGSVTANFVAVLEAFLQGVQDGLLEVETLTQGQVDTAELGSAIENLRSILLLLNNEIRNAIANPSQAATIGELSGVPIILDHKTLRNADQYAVAVGRKIIADTLALASARAVLDAGSCGLLLRGVFLGLIERPDLDRKAVSEMGANLVKCSDAVREEALVLSLGALVLTPFLGISTIAGVVLVGVPVLLLYKTAATLQCGRLALELSGPGAQERIEQCQKEVFPGLNNLIDTALSIVLGKISKPLGLAFDLHNTTKSVRDKGPVYLSDIQTFISAGPGVLEVTPPEGFSSSGPEGGPFSPLSKTYTLKNIGGRTINFSVSKAQSWVSLTKTSGSLAPDASTPVGVAINPNANDLPQGSHSDTVSFTNTTNGKGNTSRSVSLTVIARTGVFTGSFDATGSFATGFGCTFSGNFRGTITVTLAQNTDGTVSGSAVVTGNWSITRTAGSGCVSMNGSLNNTLSVSGTTSNITFTSVTGLVTLSFHGSLNATATAITGTATFTVPQQLTGQAVDTVVLQGG